MTISELIAAIEKQSTSGVEVRYVHPTLFVIFVDVLFEGLDRLGREKALTGALATTPEELAEVLSSPILELHLLTPTERQTAFDYLDLTYDGSQHWIAAFSPVAAELNPGTTKEFRVSGTRAIHFYGYKGGQARSTVLLSLAKLLADSGFRVLIVDADIEAPSMDAMLGVTASELRSTFMGLSETREAVTPIVRAYVGSSNTGQIDLLPCRPPSSSYDMDFAAFLLNCSLDTNVLVRAISRLRSHINGSAGENLGKYDVVFFDHRTGLAPSVLPIMDAWPGPVVIFVRPDGMARHIQESKLLDTLLSYDSETPGAFVSFSLDPQKTMPIAREMHGKVIEGFLEKISDALTKSRQRNDSDEADDIDPTELDRYWVFWSHDSHLVDGRQPSPASISVENRMALSQLRAVIGLSGAPLFQSERKSAVSLTSSGSSDQGQFILTPDFAKLFSIESQYTYIFGRKGTGKTRLLTELCRQKLGEPLLVAHDSEEGGIQSGGPLFHSLMDACGRNFELFWWTLLLLAIAEKSTVDAGFEGAVGQRLRAFNVTGGLSDVISQVEAQVGNTPTRRVFLIDGVETAVAAAELRPFVESLFRFLASLQYHRVLSKAVTVRLFLRSDLKTGASQNVEQQIEGRVINLHWNKTAILNFALARIVSLDWFRTAFANVCAQIESRSEEISRGALADDVAEALLLEIFPRSLERNKLKSTTFFATYFSDTGGYTDRPAFYPRLFDGFLRVLDQKCRHDESKELPDGRLPSVLVLQAYDQASKDYLADVRTELHAFLNIEQDDAENKDAVDSLIQAFNGLSTPFVVEEIIPELYSRTGIPTDKIRQALRSMHVIGIFESRAGYPGEWRTGRLYKAGLAMKYVRKKESGESWTQGDLLSVALE